MPRRSSASFEVSPIRGELQVPKASTGLPVEVRTIFDELIRTTPAGHFRVSDGPVLEAFASAVAMARKAELELASAGPVTPAGRVSPWLRVQAEAGKIIASLSMRLRLCPQARMTSRATSREKEYIGPRPWQGALYASAASTWRAGHSLGRDLVPNP